MRIDSELLSKSRPKAVSDSYQVTLNLSIADPVHLWTAAASVLLTAPGMAISDVVEVIGPPEDPQIEECIAALIPGNKLPGCALQDMEVERLQPRKVVKATRVPTPRRPSPASLSDISIMGGPQQRSLSAA